jgi:outer membrane protein assembly factor BamB
MSRGYRSGPALRAGGQGDVANPHLLWRSISRPSSSTTGSSTWRATRRGQCDRRQGGARVWQERIEGIFTASPVAGDGKVYLVSETGDTIVLAAGREPRVLARNPLGERLVGSPAIARGQLFLRSDDHLIAIGPAQREAGK